MLEGYSGSHNQDESMNMKYCTKLVLSLVATSALVYFIVFAFFLTRYRVESLSEATARLDMEVERHGHAILNELNLDIGITRALAKTFIEHETVQPDLIWEHVSGNFRNVLQNTSDLLTVWGSFELSEYQPGYDKTYGRKYISACRKGDEVTSLAYDASMEGDSPSDIHTLMKQNPRENMDDPYWYSVTEDGKNEQLITSFASPILKNGKYIGVVGVDITLKHYLELISDIRPYEGSYTFLISGGGRIVSHPDSSYIDQLYSEVLPDEVQLADFDRHHREKTAFSFTCEKDRDDMYISYYMLPMGYSSKPWVLGLATPKSRIMQSANRTTFYLIIAGLIGLIFIAGITFLLARVLTNVLQKVMQFIEQVNDGDLSARLELKRQDELGVMTKALSQMVSSLHLVVKEVQSTSLGISTAGGFLRRNSKRMSADANRQAATVEEIASAMEEMVSNIHSNSDHARRSEGIAQSTESKLQLSSSKTVEAAGAVRKINNRIGVISDIAMQTNILSLNAAVEAARAGEQGRGFAVVAAEVRKLAEKSRTAAEQITSLSELTADVSVEAGEHISQLLPDMSLSTQLARDIATSGLEQASGADQINSSIQELNHITQSNSAFAEEFAANAGELASESRKLIKLVKQFKV